MDAPSAPPPARNTNFSNGIIVLTVVPASLSTIVVGLRVAIRALIVDGLGWDDYTMLFAVVRQIPSAKDQDNN